MTRGAFAQDVALGLRIAALSGLRATLPRRLKPRLQTAPSPPARAPRPTVGQSAPRLGSGQAPADFELFVGANSFAGQSSVYRQFPEGGGISWIRHRNYGQEHLGARWASGLPPQRGGDTSARGNAPGGSLGGHPKTMETTSPCPPLARASIFCACDVAAPFQGALLSRSFGRRSRGTAQAEACGYRRSTVLGKRSTPLFKFMQEGDTERL
jgi:hypothetical protein